MKARLWLVICSILILALVLTPSAQGQEPEPIHIIIWDAFGGDTLPYLDRMLADFNQTHPGIIAETAAQGSYEDTFSALEQRVREAANFQPPADNPNASAPPVPHLVHITSTDVNRAVSSGLFMPLPEVPAGYYDSLLQSFAVDGAQYGIPWNMSLPVLYANTDLMARAGITEMPTTFAAFTEACDRLGGACATWPIDAWIVRNWTGGAALDSPTFSNFASWWTTMNASGHYVSNRRLADWNDALGRFQRGEVAFLVASTTDAPNLRQQASFALQSGPLPDAPGGFIPQGGALWMTSGHSPEEQAATQTLLTWLTNTENSVRWHKGTGFLVTRPLALDILIEQAAVLPSLTVSVEMLSNQTNVIIADTPQISQILEEGLLRIIGGAAVDREVANMMDRISRATGE